MKKQIKILIKESKISKSLPLLQELQRSGFISDNGVIEYEDTEENNKRIDEILAKYSI